MCGEVMRRSASSPRAASLLTRRRSRHEDAEPGGKKRKKEKKKGHGRHSSPQTKQHRDTQTPRWKCRKYTAAGKRVHMHLRLIFFFFKKMVQNEKKEEKRETENVANDPENENENNQVLINAHVEQIKNTPD